jgi:hypothetical protein
MAARVASSRFSNLNIACLPQNTTTDGPDRSDPVYNASDGLKIEEVVRVARRSQFREKYINVYSFIHSTPPQSAMYRW